jgi:hypothetical protein
MWGQGRTRRELGNPSEKPPGVLAMRAGYVKTIRTNRFVIKVAGLAPVYAPILHATKTPRPDLRTSGARIATKKPPADKTAVNV